jgi:hypothetical protein
MALMRAMGTAVVLLLGATGVRAAVRTRGNADANASANANANADANADANANANANADGELRFDVARAAVLPVNVDAPGTDSSVAGRPLEATRLLDTAVDAAGSRLRIYATPAAAASVEPALSRAILGRGFARMSTVDPATVTFARGNDFVVLRFARRDERTIVSVIELGFRSVGDPQ